MRTALVINDSTAFRKIVTSILGRLEFVVTEAETVSGGVDACIAGMPDVILLDVTMKAGGSLSTISLIRHLDGGDKPKIIGISPLNDVAIIARALHDGANEFLVRPFDSTTVREKLLEVGAI